MPTAPLEGGRCSCRADGRSRRGLAARAGAGGAVVPVAGSARALLRATASSLARREPKAPSTSDLARATRKNKWGRDRKYVVAFLSSGSPQQPLAEFVAADDYQETRELVAVIRGSDGGRRMYGAGDALPRCLRGTLSNPDVQRAGRLSGRLEQGRRGRARGRRRNDAQPRADPGPAAAPNVGQSRRVTSVARACAGAGSTGGRAGVELPGPSAR